MCSFEKKQQKLKFHCLNNEYLKWRKAAALSLCRWSALKSTVSHSAGGSKQSIRIELTKAVRSAKFSLSWRDTHTRSVSILPLICRLESWRRQRQRRGQSRQHLICVLGPSTDWMKYTILPSMLFFHYFFVCYYRQNEQQEREKCSKKIALLKCANVKSGEILSICTWMMRIPQRCHCRVQHESEVPLRSDDRRTMSD